MKKVLFVCYGSGHVRMVLPVAQRLQAAGLAQVQVLGLTTAAADVRAAGLSLLQFKDFVEAADAKAMEHGRSLAAAMGEVADVEETAAYLGLSHADLESEVGVPEAARRYARDGRQAFLPRRTLGRILRQVRPDLVVATNSPRAERAAVEAARTLGIPAVCIVDLFAIDEVRWIGQAGYADRICVLNDAVRDFLLAARRLPGEVVVTGNPAFDVLRDAAVAAQGAGLRRARGWDRKRVLLWPAQVEPALHPFSGVAGDTSLPARALQAVVDWTLLQRDAILCVRPRAGQPLPALPDHPRIVVTGQDWPLPPLLHAVDLVVTLTSTVGLEGHLAGARLVQVLGSVFEQAMPLQRFGIADVAVPLEQLSQSLDTWSRAGRRPAATAGPAAADAVLAEIAGFL
ncbi:MAG: hypothetical protein JWP65_3222 [Ramlibacter sp.]|uniref:UDP-glycosyltransferase n=1 Tax=Ramlibacter sp. TaxID=1917967 RepID=UPI0026260133|nr:UDP-glycosyltransferase [Ramlibacter sp.]MDB5752801.1 hypothetical protein [Ramlibacter sp.]